MLVMAIIIFLIVSGFILINFKNKYVYVIGVYFYSVVVLMITTVLYVSRLSNFPFVSALDRNIYQYLLLDLRLQFSQIVWLSNIGVALFLFSSGLFIYFFLKSKFHYIILTLVPLIFFLYWTSPEHCWKLYLQLYRCNNLAESNAVQAKIVIEDCMSVCIFVIYTMIPLVCLIINYIKTKIPLMRKYALVYFLCIVTIDIYIYYFFVYGVYSSVMFFHVDLMKFPEKIINVQSAKYTAPFSFLAVLILVLCLMFVYRPFNTFTVVLRREMVRNSISLNQNLRMLLHTYKNSFLGIEKLCQMSEYYIQNQETDKALDKVKEIQWVSKDSMDKIAKMLDLLRDVAIRYHRVDVAVCIEEAIKKAALSTEIEIERNYVEGSAYILGDEDHLTEVFVNLLENSSEAMQKVTGRTPKIQINIIQEYNMVYISILDNGCGIDKKDQRKVFRAFFSSKPSAMYGGIGLNYVKKVITQLNGEISLKSVKGQYTRFDLYFSIYHEKGAFLWKKKQNK